MLCIANFVLHCVINTPLNWLRVFHMFYSCSETDQKYLISIWKNVRGKCIRKTSVWRFVTDEAFTAIKPRQVWISFKDCLDDRLIWLETLEHEGNKSVLFIAVFLDFLNLWFVYLIPLLLLNSSLNLHKKKHLITITNYVLSIKSAKLQMCHTVEQDDKSCNQFKSMATLNIGSALLPLAEQMGNAFGGLPKDFIKTMISTFDECKFNPTSDETIAKSFQFLLFKP